MQLLDVEKLDREDFLNAPALFRYGPWALTVASFLIALGGFFAAMWRIDDGRINEYIRALNTAHSTAVAAREDFAQSLDRVRQVSSFLETLQRRHPQDSPQVLIDGLYASEPLILATYAIDAHGDVVGAKAAAALSGIDAGAMALRQAARIAGADRFLDVLHGSDLPALLPIIHDMASPGRIDRIVYLVSVDALTQAAQGVFGTYGGWLRLRDAAGRTLLEMQRKDGRDRFGPTLQPIFWQAEHAMNHPMRYDSVDLLAAQAPAGNHGLTADVGVTEAYALIGYQRRVVSTWIIAWGLAMCILGLVVLTALAIRKFAKKEAYLRRLATIDALTGLPNRRSFHALLDRCMRQASHSGRSLSLLFLDLDNFKSVNDSVGHTAGDALLKHVAATLSALTPRGSYVCRLAGDEFTVLLPQSTSAQARLTAERMLEQLKAVAPIAGMQVRTRASIGVASFPEHAGDGGTLMRFADTAMYRAKDEGRARCVVFDSTMTACDNERAKLMLDLEAALVSSGLTLVYQPKFSLIDGRVQGFEALLRWTHPQLGPISPASFIPYAEESGLIIEVGAWVVREALAQMRRWKTQTGVWFPIAVNVSARQLADEAFVLLVAEALAAEQVPGCHLQLELTESALARDAAHAAGVIHRLRSLGLTIAIDDFGTGYSSMASLQQFEVDCLKLDRSFVNRVDTKEGLEVCKAVIALGQALNLRVVAEGVETWSQCQALRALSCHEVQGFLFSRPVSAAAVPTIEAVSLAAPPASPRDADRAVSALSGA